MSTGAFAGIGSSGRLLALRRRLTEALGRLSSGGGHVVQKAVAAGAAWWLATVLLGHERPAFAAIAAIIATGAAAGKEGRQAADLAFGVASGLVVAHLLVSTLGVGVFQIGAVVGIATAAALLLGKGELLVNEAAISALLVIVLVPASGSTMPMERFLDGLVGIGAALTIHLIFPDNPRRDVQRAARPIFSDLAAALRDTAAAVHSGDPERAEAALRNSRELDAKIVCFKEALAVSHATFHRVPSRKQALGQLGFYATAADQLDLAVRNVRVLARAAVSLTRNGKSAEGLAGTIQELSMAVDALAEYVESPDHPSHTRDLALEAAGEATSALAEQRDLDTNMLVGQIRSTAVDLLRASGMDSESALAALQETSGDSSETAG